MKPILTLSIALIFHTSLFSQTKNVMSIGNDTIVIEDTNEIPFKCSGKLSNIDVHYFQKTTEESGYTYFIGSRKTSKIGLANNDLKSLSIILVEDAVVKTILNLSLDFHPAYNLNISPLKELKPKNVSEVVEINMNQAFCGGFNGSVVVLRVGNKLIEGPKLFQYGEPGIEYFYQDIISPNKTSPDQIWLKTTVGKDSDIYFEYIEKFNIINDKTILTNPAITETYFVTAKSGLTMRSEPSLNGKNIGRLEYGSKVKVLNKTNKKLEITDNIEKKSGYWVQIENVTDKLYDHSIFVFDGFLSKEKNK